MSKVACDPASIAAMVTRLIELGGPKDGPTHRCLFCGAPAYLDGTCDGTDCEHGR